MDTTEQNTLPFWVRESDRRERRRRLERWGERRDESCEEEQWMVVLVYEGDNSATAMVAERTNYKEREREIGWREWCWREMRVGIE